MLKALRPRRVLDLGTGTGVLAIAAAKALQRKVLASDIDPPSVAVARENARLNETGHLVTTVRATGFAAPQFAKAGPFDLTHAISLDKLAEFATARTLEHNLLPLRAGLDDIPALSLSPDQAGLLRQGRVLIGIAASDGLYFATSEEIPVALVEVQDREVRVVRGFNL